MCSSRLWGVIFCITVQAKEAIDWPFLISLSTWKLTQAGETNYELHFFFLVIVNFVLLGTVKGAANSRGGCTSGQQQKMKSDKHLSCIAPSHLSRVLQTQQVDKSCFTMCFLFRVLICRSALFLLFLFCLALWFFILLRSMKKTTVYSFIYAPLFIWSISLESK